MKLSHQLHKTPVSWSVDGQPYSEQFQDVYFSSVDGFRETEYVFLQHNGFPERFLCHDNNPVSTIRIAETGFGTGLNFLVSLYHWQKIPVKPCHVEYISVEKYPLAKAQIKRVYGFFQQQWPELSNLCDNFLSQYPDNFNRQQQYCFELEKKNALFSLKLIINDATTGLQQLLPDYEGQINAWYLDGFAPAKNPDMWTDTLFSVMTSLSRQGATLSTFTASSQVRKSLIASGFQMHKAPGFGKKRELLYGIKC